MSDVTVEVFFSQTCPHCPAQKELADQFAEEDHVTVRHTDVAAHQGRAKQHGVRSVPTTVVSGPEIDEKLGFTGVMSTERLDDAIKVAMGMAKPELLERDSTFTKIKEKLFG